MRTAHKVLAIGCIGAVAATLAALPWRLAGPDRRAEIASFITRATGLEARLAGPVTLKLLPWPRVRIGGVSIAASDGAMQLDAPVLYGDLDIDALIHGHWRLATATITDPVFTIDADRTFDRAALAAVDRTGFKLSLRSGVLRLLSQTPAADTLLTDLNLTAEQGNAAEGSLSLSGSAVWHGAFSQFAVRVADPRAVLEGGTSPAFAQVSSTVGSASAVGELTGGAQPQFMGRFSASTGALPRLLSAIGIEASWLQVSKATLSGDAVARAGDVSLSGSDVHLDEMGFEGTLGYHHDASRSLIEGTLATGLLDANKLGAGKLDAATFGVLYRSPWSDDPAPVNLDLRISATKARFGPVELDEAALSALFRDRRLELTLDEATAYGGTVKARGVATVGPDGLDAHADINAAGVQLGPMSEAMFGQQRIDGELTGKLGVAGRGRSVSEVVSALGGDGQLAIDHGTLTGVSVSQALKRLTRRLPPVTNSGQITSFDQASAAMRVERGVLTLVDGQMIGPGISLSFGGKSDLPKGKVSIVAVAAQTDAAGAPLADGPRLPFEMRTGWGEPLTVIDRTRGVSLPFLLPFDPGLR